jgi:hypothetical protein
VRTIGLWESVEAHAKALLDKVRHQAPRAELEYRSPDATVLGMFWRSVRLYDGVLLLLREQLPEEAAFLARSLFETALRLQQLAEEADDRDGLSLHYVNRSIDEKVGLLKVAKQLDLDQDIDGAVGVLEAERRALNGYRQRHNVRSLRSFRSVRDAALRFGRKEDYWFYEWCHESVHGTDACWMFARHKGPNEALGFHAKTDHAVLRASLAGFAATSVTQATVATFVIFGWQLPDEFVESAKEIERLLGAAAAG